MRTFFAVGALTLAALAATGALAGGSLKSGLQVGENPTPFDPLHITGPGAGEKSCLV